jgi:Zn-dependent M28 family amino/carboxypeptidase
MSPDIMTKVSQALLAAFKGIGWEAQEQAYVLHNVRAMADYHSGSGTTYEKLSGSNLVAIKPGSERPNEAFVVVAHYDTVRNSPGADDNTASVASILELARILGPDRFRRTVILAATDMEELGLLGSKALLPWLRSRYNVVGVIVLETVAYTDPRPHTLRLPNTGPLYRAQFARVAQADWASRFEFVLYRTRGKALAATFATALETFAGKGTSIVARDPADLPLLGFFLRRLQRNLVREFHRSDHVPFWEAGIPAVQVTDGANFGNPHYHAPTDLPDTLDFRRLKEVVLGTALTIAICSGLYVDR